MEKVYSNQAVKAKPVLSEQVILQSKKAVFKIKHAENTTIKTVKRALF